MRSLFSKIFSSIIITSICMLIIVLGSMYVATRISTNKWNDKIVENYQEILEKNLAFAEEQESLGRTVIFKDIIINSIEDNRISAITFTNTDAEEGFRWTSEKETAERPPKDLNRTTSEIPIEYMGVATGTVEVITLSPNNYELTKDYINRLLFTLVISLIASVIISLILAYLLSKKIATPITQISRSLAQLTEGINSAEINTNIQIKELFDISKAAERLQQEFISNERSRATWLNNIGHDLNTPVTSLRVQIEGLSDHVFTPSDKIFNSMKNELTILGNRISSFMDLSQLDSPDLEVVYSNIHSSEFLLPLLSSYEELQNKRSIEVVHEIENFTFSSDLELLTKATGAILENAFAYTPDGGIIRVFGKEVPEGTLFIIENTGRISPDILPQIFHELIKDDFSRGRSGAGLGLSVVKRITTLLEGTVTLKNTEDAMVQCRLLLPHKR